MNILVNFKTYLQNARGVTVITFVCAFVSTQNYRRTNNPILMKLGQIVDLYKQENFLSFVSPSIVLSLL